METKPAQFRLLRGWNWQSYQSQFSNYFDNTIGQNCYIPIYKVKLTNFKSCLFTFLDERNCLDRRESLDSETDNESSNTGKYISDFAEAFQNTPSDHQVAHINGLLSLPSSRETRYGITYGELKRRCGAPEYLTRVDLVAYVRHSKSSGRGLLDKYKIVSENRASRPNVMSKMCENEARVFADGILRMNMEYFPGKVLAEIATERLKKGLQKEPQDEEQQEKLKGDIKAKMKHIETTRY